MDVGIDIDLGPTLGSNAYTLLMITVLRLHVPNKCRNNGSVILDIGLFRKFMISAISGGIWELAE